MQAFPKKLLIASSSPDEAITRVLLNHQAQFELTMDIVFLQDFIKYFEVDDEVSDTGTKVQWFGPSGLYISNETHHLLNRILSMPESLFLDFSAADREYAKREFEAYLGHSLSAFQSATCATVSGMAHLLYSLPEQWQRLASYQTIQTPNYYWGPKAYYSPASFQNDLVHSDIYDIFNWQTSTKPIGKSHIFCFEKPKGTPIFALCLGDAFFLETKAPPTNKLKIKLQAVLSTLRTCFNYFIFEVLLFVESDTICFGCVNLQLTRMAKHEAFERFVIQHFIPEYIKCLN